MFIADLHIHSRYSRATSSACEPIQLDYWARRKGLHLIASGDFTHRVYREQLRQSLLPAEEGVFVLDPQLRIKEAGVANDAILPRFVISGEISSIYKDKGKVRKVHNLICLPDFESAEKLSQSLEGLGCNLHSDGRPIIGLSSHDLLELTLAANDQALFIPAHIWTPHFSLFGAYSGYDAIEECFGDLTPNIYALETGLSSDPQMNHRLSSLDDYALVSNSDAHSPAKLAREANIFNCELSYPNLFQALKIKHSPDFWGTLEFFPEEGKYHWDGHRECKYSGDPAAIIAHDNICPICGKKVTLGVSHRVEELADRPADYQAVNARPDQKLVPLMEAIAACMEMTTAAKKVQHQYEKLLGSIGAELFILREAPLAQIEQESSSLIAEGISRLRQGQIKLIPGYDGEFGKVTIFSKEEINELKGQSSLFDMAAYPYQEQTIPDLMAATVTAGENPDELRKNSKQTADLADGLNQKQWQAAKSAARDIVVIAGPGTGKTKTLVERIIHLLEQGTPAEKIIAVTFTVKAARELKQRISNRINDPKKVKSMHIGTFHALARQMLKADNQEKILINQYSAQILAQEIIDKFQLKLTPAKLLRMISAEKNMLKKELSKEIYQAYQQKLAAYQAQDFDDLLTNALVLAKSNPQLTQGAHLLLDEFQDINDLQYQLLEAWNKTAVSLFLIGDPDQSIYGFRGAKASVISGFLQDHPHAQKITLTDNYRSTKDILACAASLFADDSAHIQAKRDLSLPVLRVDAQSPLSEGIFIAREIERLIGGIDMITAHQHKDNSQNSISPADIAVVYRTHKQAEHIAYCLETAGIPYTISGREDYLADEQIQLCLAFFRLLKDPHDQLARMNCQKKIDQKKLSLLEENFMEIVNQAKPLDLIEEWIDKNYLSGNPAMEKLKNSALLYPSIGEFLDSILLGEESDIIRNSSQAIMDSVSLMTLHAAKGLEFPVVFIAGIKEGLLPFHGTDSEDDFEEEKRLFYVGMTRAKDQLFLLGGPPESSLLTKIPADLFKSLAADKPRGPRSTQMSLFEEK